MRTTLPVARNHFLWLKRITSLRLNVFNYWALECQNRMKHSIEFPLKCNQCTQLPVVEYNSNNKNKIASESDFELKNAVEIKRIDMFCRQFGCVKKIECCSLNNSTEQMRPLYFDMALSATTTPKVMIAWWIINLGGVHIFLIQIQTSSISCGAVLIRSILLMI